MEKVTKQKFLQLIDASPQGEIQIMGIQNGHFLFFYQVEKPS
jgi:hypothetical protein